MTTHSPRRLSIFLTSCILTIAAASTPLLVAQNPDVQQKVADLKAAMAKNKQALAQYTWVETDTISLKGEQKKQDQYQVTLGPDGKPPKTPMGQPAPPAQPASSGRRGGRVKEHVVEKKTGEYKEYAESIKALIQQYVPPDKDALEQAKQKGNISASPEAGTPGQFKLVITNYIKQGDNMTLVVDKTTKALISLSIATYLSDPKDAVNVTVQFAAIPGGPNHVASQTINGVSKQLTIAVQNSNYQKTQSPS